VLLERTDHAAAAALADELADDGADAAEDAFSAAVVLAYCAGIVETDTRVAPAKRPEMARAYADRAMGLLKQAVGRGFCDAARLRNNAAFAPLRQRADFQELLRQLETRPGSKTAAP
jgi:hypothetical protein